MAAWLGRLVTLGAAALVRCSSSGQADDSLALVQARVQLTDPPSKPVTGLLKLAEVGRQWQPELDSAMEKIGNGAFGSVTTAVRLDDKPNVLVWGSDAEKAVVAGGIKTDDFAAQGFATAGVDNNDVAHAMGRAAFSTPNTTGRMPQQSTLVAAAQARPDGGLELAAALPRPGPADQMGLDWLRGHGKVESGHIPPELMPAALKILMTPPALSAPSPPQPVPPQAGPQPHFPPPPRFPPPPGFPPPQSPQAPPPPLSPPMTFPPPPPPAKGGWPSPLPPPVHGPPGQPDDPKPALPFPPQDGPSQPHPPMDGQMPSPPPVHEPLPPQARPQVLPPPAAPPWPPQPVPGSSPQQVPAGPGSWQDFSNYQLKLMLMNISFDQAFMFAIQRGWALSPEHQLPPNEAAMQRATLNGVWRIDHCVEQPTLTGTILAVGDGKVYSQNPTLKEAHVQAYRNGEYALILPVRFDKSVVQLFNLAHFTSSGVLQGEGGTRLSRVQSPTTESPRPIPTLSPSTPAQGLPRSNDSKALEWLLSPKKSEDVAKKVLSQIFGGTEEWVRSLLPRPPVQ